MVDENFFTGMQVKAIYKFLDQVNKNNKKMDKLIEDFGITIQTCVPTDKDLLPYYDSYINLLTLLKSLTLKLATYNVDMDTEFQQVSQT